MYEYYQKVNVTEHCLRAEEIAGIFGIFTASHKPHAMLMGALLKEKNAPIYYYESSKGLLKGYRFKDYYPIAIEFINRNAFSSQVKINDKNFKMILEPKFWQQDQLRDKLNSIYAPEYIEL